MFLVIGTDMNTNTPCCKGGYNTLNTARDRLIDLMHEDDDIDNYIIQEVNEGVDYNNPKTYILVSIENNNDNNELEDEIKKTEQDELEIVDIINDVESKLDKFKQDWLCKKVKINEMRNMLKNIKK